MSNYLSLFQDLLIFLGIVNIFKKIEDKRNLNIYSDISSLNIDH